jgi:hypothetical protein
MKKLTTLIAVLALLSNLLFISCNSNESKKNISKEDQDFSSSGVIKEMEEMQKAAEGGKPAMPANPAATQQPSAPPAPQK